jgi:hypothetical protein
MFSMNDRLREKSRKAVELARKNGRILDVSEAFKKYPVENEWHKGELKNWNIEVK